MSEPSAPPIPAADAQPFAEERHLRADARRNRAAILEAAEAVFSSQGPDAPIDDIARRAGVGVGTLYRHFPTKQALLRALVSAHIEPLVAAAHEASRSPEPGVAFFALLHRLAQEFAGFKAVADVIAASGVDLHTTKSAASEGLMAAAGAALARAQEAGAVRRDVSIAEVASMTGALCQAEGLSHDQIRLSRCVDLICDGLRSPESAPGHRPPARRA
jgi:AcrR family transcriptional regulator